MHRLLGAFAVLVAGIVLTISVALPAGAATHVDRPGHQDFPPAPGGTPIVIEPHIPTPPSQSSGPPKAPAAPKRAASLSAQQRSLAVSVALKDRYVKRLVQGKRNRVGAVRIWLDGKGAMKGAIISLAFDRPQNVGGEWPAVARKPVRATYRGVPGLRVFVDLHLRRVVAIVPGVQASSTQASV